jgi:hypothetical protein
MMLPVRKDAPDAASVAHAGGGARGSQAALGRTRPAA